MRRFLFIICVALLLPSIAACEGLISADAGDAKPFQVETTLYFRFRDTALLAQERRVITVARDESYEKALVRALLSGPSAPGGELSGVFPQATNVLSTQAQDGILYVTFDEGLLSKYNDEPALLSGMYWQQEAPLRRHLAIAALTATLTESGEYHAVQVLVRGQTSVTTSMRLHAGYFLEGEDALLEPMSRDESLLMTPHNTALACMTAWLERDWASVWQYTSASKGRPSQYNAQEAFDTSDALISISLSSGSVSPNGQTALVCADLTLLSKDGVERAQRAWPIMLVREYGAWLIPYAQLTAIMQLTK